MIGELVDNGNILGVNYYPIILRYFTLVSENIVPV